VTPFEQVAEFAAAFGVRTSPVPSSAGLGAADEELALRRRLLDEEVGEFADAVAERNLTAVADALADIVTSPAARPACWESRSTRCSPRCTART